MRAANFVLPATLAVGESPTVRTGLRPDPSRFRPFRRSRQKVIRESCYVGQFVKLVPESENKHGEEAVDVYLDSGEQIGYLREHVARSRSFEGCMAKVEPNAFPVPGFRSYFGKLLLEISTWMRCPFLNRLHTDQASIVYSGIRTAIARPPAFQRFRQIGIERNEVV